MPTVLVNTARRYGSAGHLKEQLWLDPTTDIQAEISINLEALHDDESVCSMICHQLVLLWQRIHGRPSRLGYHNHEWAQKMIEIGLMPSSTGRPGGHLVGQKMSHYPIEGGLFSRAFNTLPNSLLGIPRLHRKHRPQATSEKRHTYYCPCRPANRCLAAAGFKAMCSFCGSEFTVKTPMTRRKAQPN